MGQGIHSSNVMSYPVPYVLKRRMKMARRQRRGKKNTWLWYGLYAAAAYYGYNWFKQYQAQQAIASTTTVVPIGTQQ